MSSLTHLLIDPNWILVHGINFYPIMTTQHLLNNFLSEVLPRHCEHQWGWLEIGSLYCNRASQVPWNFVIWGEKGVVNLTEGGLRDLGQSFIVSSELMVILDKCLKIFLISTF